MNATTDRATVELKRIVDLFSTKSLPTTISKVLIETAGKPSEKWSLGNKLIMLANGTLDARGFRQWQQVGRYVKKGTRAFYILSPNTYKIKVFNEQTKQEEERIRINGFRGTAVFRYEDTEGQSIEYQPKTIPPLMEVAKRLGIPVNYEDTRLKGAYGYYDLEKKEIVLGTEDISTFFHELTHAVHHTIEDLRGGQKSEHEAIAQLAACTLASLYGYNIESQSWTYIANYAENKTVEAVGKICMRVLKKVDQILKLILGESEDQ